MLAIGRILGRELFTTYHRRQYICQGSCQLKHYDNNGDGDMHDTAEGCCGAEESIGPGRDTRYVRLACCKELCMRKRLMQGLDNDAHHPSE